LKGEIKKINQFNKRQKKKSKEWGPNWKKKMVNWDLKMELETNKTSTKRPKTKIMNQKTKYWSWNANNKES